ncbi:MAG TPA: DUF2332 family protein [Allosphingosinicella sp.]|nr:DUF2332 family protein [Allosphingosinicella sp.]
MPASATEREAAIRAVFAEQARWCVKLGSPFTARICRLLGERIDRSTGVGQRLLDWPGDPSATADALALRLCGGLHALVRSGDAPGLAACYPPFPEPDEEALWAVLAETLARPELTAWLDRAPQTNEVGRSAVLMSGLLVVATRFAQPIELLELGASAGLNLNLDRYGYDLGGLEVGDPHSAVRLAPEWKGFLPPEAEVRIVGRRGVDLAPLDPAGDGERLLAYVWPDQSERLARLEAALTIAAEHPPGVERDDAAPWTEARLAETQCEGVTRVLLHSVAFQYFPMETQARIAAAAAKAGDAASGARPFAWLRYEMVPGDERYSLRLRVWPGGEDKLLAWCHPHGTSVSWLAEGPGR